MKWNIWSNRRQEERRSEPDDAGGRRKAQRREDDRRNFVRLYYPLTAAPKVLNANFRILDLSENGIKLLCKNKCEECADPISLKSVLNLKIQFHDGQISDIVVKINRCEAIPNGKDKNYAGSITKGMTAERIDKEEAYLLSLSPQSDLEEEE